MTMGETIVPKKIPSLNQSLLNGANNLELRIPKIKKTIDKANDHNLIFSSYFKGHKATIKNTIKNTNPKLLFDEIFILEFKVTVISFIQNSFETTFSKLMFIISI